MILVTGGLGFIGSHTARALLDLGESCVLTSRRGGAVPALLGEAGSRVVIEQADAADRDAFFALGERHQITGIVHLAAPAPSESGTIDFLAANTQALLNALAAAERWGVRRISLASSVGVYMGVSESVQREDVPLPTLPARSPISVFKKAAELFSSLVAESDGLDVVHLRIATIWGPLCDPASPFFALPHLVHHAVRGVPLAEGRPVAYADAGADLCYARDCGRAIALLQLADSLRHRTYNVADGRVTTNAQVADALRAAVPGTEVELTPGAGRGRNRHLDITRLREDTGYEPAYGIDRGMADYVSWLREGHPA